MIHHQIYFVILSSDLLVDWLWDWSWAFKFCNTSIFIQFKHVYNDKILGLNWGLGIRLLQFLLFLFDFIGLRTGSLISKLENKTLSKFQYLPFSLKVFSLWLFFILTWGLLEKNLFKLVHQYILMLDFVIVQNEVEVILKFLIYKVTLFLILS